MAANTDDFLGESGSTLSPFGAGTVAPLSLAEQSRLEDARRERLRIEAANTANINNAPGGYASERGAADREIIAGSNEASIADRAARGRMGDARQRGFLGNLVRDPVTMSVLAAPYAVLGAGALAGGLASGGVGSIATPAGVSPYVGGSAGTGLGAGGEAAALAGSQAGGAPASIAAANKAAGVITGGASSAGVAGGAIPRAVGAAGTAAASSVPSWLNPVLGGVASGAAMYGLDRLTSGRTPEEKRLLEKQQQMADEAARRREQVQQQSMDALGQQLMAFAPLNQAMASMYGPEAAFTQEQFANMAQNPMRPDVDPALFNYTGNDPEMLARAADAARRIQQYDAAEEARRASIMGGMPAPGPGPAPIQMPAPQAARRY